MKAYITVKPKVVQRDLAQRACQLARYLRTQRASNLETPEVSLFIDFNFHATLYVTVGYRGSNMVAF